MDYNGKSVGPRIREIRVARGLTLLELAARAGINNGTLSVLERGITEPTLATVVAIARELGVDLESLVLSGVQPAPLGDIPSDVLGYARHPKAWPYIRAIGTYLTGTTTEARAARLLYKVAKQAQGDIDADKR